MGRPWPRWLGEDGATRARGAGTAPAAAETDALDGGDVLPGFRLALAELFRDVDEQMALDED